MFHGVDHIIKVWKVFRSKSADTFGVAFFEDLERVSKTNLYSFKCNQYFL